MGGPLVSWLSFSSWCPLPPGPPGDTGKVGGSFLVLYALVACRTRGLGGCWAPVRWNARGWGSTREMKVSVDDRIHGYLQKGSRRYALERIGQVLSSKMK